MGTEVLRLLRLVRVGGDRRHLTAPGTAELQGHVAKAADADHRHVGGGGHGLIDQRREHGDAAAEKRAGVRDRQPLRQRDGPVLAGLHLAGEGTLAANDRRLGAAAEIGAPGQALAAVAAAAGEPAQAAQLPEVGRIDSLSHVHHQADGQRQTCQNLIKA